MLDLKVHSTSFHCPFKPYIMVIMFHGGFTFPLMLPVICFEFPSRIVQLTLSLTASSIVSFATHASATGIALASISLKLLEMMLPQ
uniref:Uncharacterized protein n=1 Tax=Nelumbo nucifera TaxID=4432 RepID=A0A822ZQN0_NELNU|nr:TPA_asm: hypothetical protein HUJ06_017479 [Nelumbo nucifera]